MEEKLKKVSNDELLYRVILEHIEYLEVEKKKVEEVDTKWLKNYRKSMMI